MNKNSTKCLVVFWTLVNKWGPPEFQRQGSRRPLWFISYFEAWSQCHIFIFSPGENKLQTWGETLWNVFQGVKVNQLRVEKYTSKWKELPLRFNFRIVISFYRIENLIYRTNSESDDFIYNFTMVLGKTDMLFKFGNFIHLFNFSHTFSFLSYPGLDDPEVKWAPFEVCKW